MELVFTLKGLDCPHCSEKIEQEVRQLAQVTAAAVDLAAQTLTVHTVHTDHADLHDTITHIVHKHEPEVEVVPCGHEHAHDQHREVQGPYGCRYCDGLRSGRDEGH